MSDTPFTFQDVQSIIAIVENQPLQNMKVAREVGALVQRFSRFAQEQLTSETSDGQSAQA